ncbi:hypothetical protein K7432_014710 [Basidiobolus ranarum]|uniref:Yeast cell wall synthesis Kre9/Knh1-like N-terminal domain-containing protein n=1 Tax=Basidiobolus ranarum TaxID=34480 RepID=A0ABR2WH49_9FUNG
MYSAVLFAVSGFSLFQMVAGDYALTSPINAIWDAGSEKIITWTETGGASTPATIDLALMSGPPTQLQLLSIIQQGVDSKAGQYKWQIPQDLPAGKQYAIRSGSGPNVKYTPYFEIKSNVPSGSTFNSPPSGNANPGSSNGSTQTPSKPNQGATLSPWMMPMVVPMALGALSRYLQ